MLTELHIENLGVIERLDLVLGAGHDRGHRRDGAGKTMLVEALELLVGGRADATIVRPGAARRGSTGASWSATTSSCCRASCRPTGGRAPTSTVGRRRSAPSPTRRPVSSTCTASTPTRACSPAPPSAPPSSASAASTSTPLRAARAQLTELDAELAALGGAARERAREIDLLRFQVAELDAAGLDDPDEDDALATREDVLADAAGHREAGAAAHGALADDGGARDAVAGSAVDGGRSGAVPATPPTASPPCWPSSTTSSPSCATPPRASTRTPSGWRRCASAGSCCATCAASTATTSARCWRTATRRRRDSPSWSSTTAGPRCSMPSGRRRRPPSRPRPRPSARPAAGPPPSWPRRSTGRLRELALPHADIGVAVDDADVAGEHVQFQLAANPGTPLLPLTRVASGGELARTMLALRLVLTAADDGPRTLVFDEVDAGIGGTAATAVGRALAEVGGRHQVLVVTHLAQVAALATTQVAVVKSVAGDGDDGARGGRRRRRAGRRAGPHAVGRPTAATPPGATPSSCWPARRRRRPRRAGAVRGRRTRAG